MRRSITIGESADDVVLEVRDSVRGHGRIVDQQTGEPINDAVLQVFSSDLLRVIGPAGPPRRVSPTDGRFTLEGFAPGRGRLRVSAPGYSVAWIETNCNAVHEVDLGDIALGRRDDLVVELVSDTEFIAGAYLAAIVGAEMTPECGSDEHGRIVFEGISSGAHTLEVYAGLEILDLLQNSSYLTHIRIWYSL